MSYDYGALVRDDRVHGSLYVEPGIFREEMGRIFRRGWSFVGHESEVAAPGDWVQRRIGGESYLLTRDAGGQVHLLANRCSHRGTALCWGEQGHDRAFQCTFHGWTFGLDGALLGVTYPGGFQRRKSDLNLDRAGQIGSYRGFVFANPSGDAGLLEAHLGPGGAALIDRACAISPTGRIRLAPNWIGQRTDSNWKMWPESDNDGYHLQFLHISTWRAIPNNQYGATMLGGESGNHSRAVDHGRGHIELDLRPSYPHELAWMATTADKVPEYRAAMVAAYGEERAGRTLWEGPPHAMIFPNLFLGEINIARVEPVAPGVTVHHHTAIQVEAAGERVNQRLRRMSEGAMGPGSFLLPEDAITAERMQVGFGGVCPAMAEDPASRAWVDLSRGQQRERREVAGTRVGLLSDETTNRGFWQHYRAVMGGGA
jgi:phenylpropionate dioxygenase-like ring-hydroxylating dioxygenase large terminal subunit